MKTKTIYFVAASIVLVLLATGFQTFVAPKIYSVNDIGRSTIFTTNGLEYLDIKGRIGSTIVLIYHRPQRLVSDDVIEKLKKLDGITGVIQGDYLIVITRSDNYEWSEIFTRPPGGWKK